MKNRITYPTKTAAAVVMMKCVWGSGLCFALNLILASTYAQSVLLADIVDRPEQARNEYSSLTSGDGRLYFIGNAQELWTSSKEDSTDLLMLHRFSAISDLTMVRSTLYFLADDGTNGPELWRSNGTVETTRIVKDIKPGPAGSSPALLINLRGTLYFVADDGTWGRELWMSNGTSKGTVLVKDIMPRGGSSNPTGLTAVGTTLFFSAKDATHGTELWKTNGTATGTVMVKDIRPGTGVNSSPSDLVNVYGTLFFVAADATSGRELWKSDGTSVGTVRVKDIAPGTAQSRISNPTAAYRTLFFTATDGIHGQELWKSDGTEVGTVMVKDMTPGPEGSQGEGAFTFEMANFINIYGTLFFTAYQNDTYYIWKSDGTTTGTVPIREAYGPGILQPRMDFVHHDNRVYFFNRLSEYDWDAVGFWSMDMGGGDFQLIAEFYQADPYNPHPPQMALVGENFYLSGQPDPFDGVKMLISDGTNEGTRLTEDISMSTHGSHPREFIEFNGELYFLAEDSWSGYENLYVTDGTPGGTEYVLTFETDGAKLGVINNAIFAVQADPRLIYKADLEAREPVTIIQDYSSAPISIFRFARNRLFFSTRQGELWTSDGSLTGTHMLHDFHSVNAMYPLGAWVFFTVVNEDMTLDLWRSDGTATGTTKITAIRTTAGLDSYYHNPFAVKYGSLTFLANDGVHGTELWRTSVTGEGTRMVTDLRTNDTGIHDDIRALMVFQDYRYISALGEDGKWGLYKYDGTIQGTIKLKDMDPVVHSIVTDHMLLLFTSSNTGTQDVADLWVTYGPANGTQMVADLNEPYGNFSHAVIDGVAYFSFMDGGELWRTDGTASGTFKVNLGSSGASPISALGKTLIFGSFDEQAGIEPHAYNTAPMPGGQCGGTASSGKIQQERWRGITGDRVSYIPVDTPPSNVLDLTMYETKIPSGFGHNYGSRVRGYVCVPATGNYTFWISSDDHGELWLSTDDNPANKTKIAYVSGWTYPRQWDKFASQKSLSVSLVAGQKYYIEALFKQAIGGDHMSVGWQLPDGTLERPIPGNRLSPFENDASTAAARTASEVELYSQIDVYPNPVQSGDPKLTISGYERMEKIVETHVEIINMTGEVVFAERVQCGGDCSSYLMKLNSKLIPGLYVVTMKTNGRRHLKRLLVK